MSSNSYDVVIAGGGPAGSSAAIQLARNGLRVLLVEQKRFPRPKLCGEFISPECLSHFERLGVAEEMDAHAPALITHTTFYSSRGQSVNVPSGWFGSGSALGLSRAIMDNNLLRQAGRLGVEVLEDATVNELIRARGAVCGVGVKGGGKDRQFYAPLTIDATGRSRTLARKVLGSQRSKPRMIAFKAHVAHARPAPGMCEIYSYPGGYGGLSPVENDVSNLCFITTADDVRRAHSNPQTVISEIVMRNRRAAYTLEGLSVSSEWLSVSLESFGRQRPNPASGLLAIGDSAAFIDPFTGSGMLMALESGQLVANTIVHYRDKLTDPASLQAISADYVKGYQRKFGARLIFCSLLRRVAFNPRLAELTIAACNGSAWLRNHVALATRSNANGERRISESTK
jgi:flavin-dependent dehydrogenase